MKCRPSMQCCLGFDSCFWGSCHLCDQCSFLPQSLWRVTPWLAIFKNLNLSTLLWKKKKSLASIATSHTKIKLPRPEVYTTEWTTRLELAFRQKLCRCIQLYTSSTEYIVWMWPVQTKDTRDRVRARKTSIFLFPFLTQAHSLHSECESHLLKVFSFSFLHVLSHLHPCVFKNPVSSIHAWIGQLIPLSWCKMRGQRGQWGHCSYWLALEAPFWTKYCVNFPGLL